jgi:hypothetical protein
MSAQVALIIVGAIFVGAAIVGGGNFLQVSIPAMPRWARVCCGVVGAGVFALAFIPGIGATSSPGLAKTNPSTSPTSPPATRSPASIATPTSTTRASASIAIQDTHTSNINYLHDVPGKMTGFKPGEAVWILVIIRGDARLYPQDECIITGEESFKCAKTQFGDPGGKGTFYARAIIVNSVQQRVLRQHYSSGLISMPKVVAKSALIRYTKG